jgi:hypothetical protein
MKDREQHLEDLIDQQNTRQLAEEERQSQLKQDLAKLMEFDRQMLGELAVRSGASQLTELLAGLFDQRYKRLEELFKVDRGGLPEVNPSAVRPSAAVTAPQAHSEASQEAAERRIFEELEGCLKPQKKSRREEGTSIDRLLDNLIENSEGALRLEQAEEFASFGNISLRDDQADLQQRKEFDEDIAQLERELSKQEQESPYLKNETDPRMLSGQLFSGMFASSLKSGAEPEQLISDLSADIDYLRDSSSLEVFNQPFGVVPVYISTDEDFNASQYQHSHEESLVCCQETPVTFPSVPCCMDITTQAELEPSVTQFTDKADAEHSAQVDSADYLDISDILPELLGDLELNSKEDDKSQVILIVDSYEDGAIEQVAQESVELGSSSSNYADEDQAQVAYDLTEHILVDLLRAELLAVQGIEATKLRDAENKGQIAKLPLTDPASPRKVSSSISEPLVKTDSQSVLGYAELILEAAGSLSRQRIEASLLTPRHKDPSQVLEMLASFDTIEFIDQDAEPKVEVIGVDVYLQLERRSEEVASMKNLPPGFFSNASEEGHIHNKMIFDCVNEALALHLPYGDRALPMPWSSETRRLRKDVDLDRVFTAVKDRLRHWSQMEVGLLPTAEMQVTSDFIDEDYLQQLREQKLASCLDTELLESDADWVNYELEEAQVKLDLADIILDHLVLEAFDLLQNLS